MAKKLDEIAGKGELTPERFLALYKDIRVAARKKDSAVAELRLTKKRAKDAGVDLDALALMEKLAAMEPEDAAARMQNLIRYRAWDGSGEQIELFAADPVAPVPETAAAIHTHGKAWEAGYDCAKDGGSIEDCIFEPGSELNQAWTTGFREASVPTETVAAPKAKKASAKKATKAAPVVVVPAAEMAAAAPLH